MRNLINYDESDNIKGKLMKKLIIIPAYNEESCIEKTVENIQKFAPSFDYIVINDCSRDQQV